MMKHEKIKPERITKILRDARKKKRQNGKKKSSHSISDNLLYSVTEAAGGSKMFLLSSFFIIIGKTAESLTLSYTDKYVIDLATGNGSQLTLAIICVLLIFGTRFFRWIHMESDRYEEQVAVQRYNYHFIRRLMHKNLTTDYENNEKASVNDALRKARDVTSYIMTVALKTLRNSISCLLNILTFGSILSLFHPVMLPIVIVPAIACYYINRRKMLWQWCLMDRWHKHLLFK